jgi:ribosomal protein L11 methyltransferase
MAEWVEIVVQANADTVDDVAAQIHELVAEAANGTEIRGDAVVFWARPDHAEHAAQQAAVLAPGGAVRCQPAQPEAEWRDAWKRYFRVDRIGPRLVIVPSWETYAPRPGDVVLNLDPGRAFGTGSHASTRLCLLELEALSPVDRFLDLGTGSGILAIAGAKLWPQSTAVAIDIDPDAVDAARENIAGNQLSPRIHCSTTALDQLHERFPLILANIQASVHMALCDRVCDRLSPAGSLVLSGLLTEQVDEVVAHYEQRGLRLSATRTSEHDPQWSAAQLRAPVS